MGLVKHETLLLTPHFFPTRKNSNQRQFTCFLFVSLIDFVFISLFLFVMGINFEWKTSPKNTQTKKQSLNLFNVFSWKHDENEKSFQKKNDLKNDSIRHLKRKCYKWQQIYWEKKFDFLREFLTSFLILKKQLLRKKKKTNQFKYIQFNCVSLWMCLEECKYI